MKRYLGLVAVLLSLPVSASAQTAEDLLRQMKALGEQASKLLPPTPQPPSTAPVIIVAAGGSIQAAVNSATVPGTLVLLKAGATYTESFIIPKTNQGVTVQTEGCPIGDRGALPTDAPALAKVILTTGQSYGPWVMSSRSKIRCLDITANPGCSGELVRIGDQASTNLTDVPDGVVVEQNYLHGSPGTVCGQKRGVLVGGSHTLIDRNWVQDIWVPGQDSQCFAMLSTPGPVTITRNVCSAGSENFLVGGVPPAGPAFLPSDVLIENNVFWKPLAWKGTIDHQIKNLGEVKLGHRITIRHNWFENHWQQAQPGPSIVLTMATNGACGYCDMQDVTFENNVVWNVSAGLSLTGYQYTYAPGAGQAVRFTIRNNLFVISKATMGGNGRPLIVSNEPKDVLVDHNTFLHDGTAVVASDYGTKWPLQDPPLTASVKAGPLSGFVFTNNAALHGSYGVFTPEGTAGINLGTYFPGAVIGGNVWGGAPAAAVTRYDAFAGSAGPNSGPAAGAFSEVYNVDMCQSGGTPTGKGADCSKLPWELRALVPR